MKKYLIQSIKVIAIAILIGSGTFAVSAWTAPTVNPPTTGVVRVPANDTAQGVFAALNTTVFPQIKKGGLIISEENKYFVSPLSFFKKVLLPEEDTSVYVGGVGTADPTFATAANFPEDRSVPLTINMSGRSTEGAIKYVADTDACAGPTKIITDSSAFQFWNDGENDHADILAKGIRLTGGNPAAGKILISVDRDGRAVWATPRLAANGVDILFDTDTSPVGTCNPVASVYTWEEKGDWGVCNIDTLQQTQTVVCKNESGMEVSESLCDPAKKPSTTKSCNIEAPICTGGNYTQISTPTCDFNTYVKRTTRDTSDNPDAASEAGVYSAKGCLVRKSGYIAGAADQCQFIPVEDVSDVPAAAPSGYVFASSCKETVNAGQYENTYQLGKINNCQVSPIVGCTDPAAINYNPNATLAGFCTYESSCLAYQIKANCYGSLPATSVYIPAGCTKTTSVGGTCATGSPQEIYNIECTSPQTEYGISTGASAAGFPATHLNNQNPQQCTGPNAPMTAWMCHTAGAVGWTSGVLTSETTCTGPYFPQLLPGEFFTEGDIVCTESKPAKSLCNKLGTPKSACRQGDSFCPNPN